MPVHLALLLPVSGAWDIGTRIAGAAALAVERINADMALLPGRWLEYRWADSGCSAQKGLAAMGELLKVTSRVDVVIGPGCSVASSVTSYLTAGQSLPQISWGSTAPSLSLKAEFPLFSRTVAPEPCKGPALIALMAHFRWKNVVIMSSTYSGTLEPVCSEVRVHC